MMTSGIILGPALLVAAGSSLAAESFREELVRVLSELDSGFVCPQFLPSDAERQAEADRFAVALADIGLNYADALIVRRKILQRHHCLKRAKPDAEGPSTLS